MKIQEIISKSIISKTGIPSADYVINPYIGCIHSCFYCYAKFMKRFTGHKENWGDFIDIKINAPALIPVLKDYKSSKYTGKRILLSSVTDPYIPLERKYEVTRKILQKLIPHQPHLIILTKSDLVIRDLDLIKQFENKEIGFSFSTLEEDIQEKVEPGASSIKNRLKALKTIHEEHITSYVFVSPIIPFITNWKEIISQTRSYADYFMFENLNIVGNIWGSVNRWLKTEFPDIIQDYKDIYFEDSIFWERIEEEIITFCQTEKLECKMYFHH
ncbi:spore photoproduct lyase family protein [Methanobacterium spitsbergense]|uniref:Radical SAM protein n=1 Tax=Methanobacterium spitsbergense TaxID=2874285 RepID=A0A8T5UMZ8_9EURY|nr:radical SAM protein [Methanobacterium spitsbergense]MBZ2165302.1 radical SAM protein [Methanobacterium spitsbergense]